jgi:glycosyltransferase involved in cell wall biosynthesis
MTTPAISVVVVFHDDERFLGEAVESVLAQTEQDWELLLCDDGSTDGSTAIARDLAAQHPERIRYLEHPGHENRGISATRNLGIAHAEGRFVAFLDSDDVWEAGKLAEQREILETHPEVGLLFGASRYWWSWAGADAPRSDRVRPIGAEQDRVHNPPDLLLALYPLGDGVSPCPSSCIARKDLLESVGGFEEEFRTMYEDQAFLAKVYLAAPVYVSSRCWDLYRRHADAVTLTTSTAEYRAVRRRYFAWLQDYLARANVDDPAVWGALRRTLWPDRHPHLSALREQAGRVRARTRRWLRRLGARR